MKQYAWMVVGVPEREELSGLVRGEYVARFGNFRELKRVLWKEWFKARVGRTDLSPAEKLLLWVLVDRWRLESWSCRDSITYLAKATGMHRNTVKRCVDRLMDKNIVIYTAEDEFRLPIPGEHTHFVLVGLGFLLRNSNVK
tara:strand:+ start:191 stop:613 length:423 start_codon:yes stop_codon:yes gene_type:complete